MVQDTDYSKGFFFDKKTYTVNLMRRHATFELQTLSNISSWIYEHKSYWEITAYAQYRVLCSIFNPSQLIAQPLIMKQ